MGDFTMGWVSVQLRDLGNDLSILQIITSYNWLGRMQHDSAYAKCKIS